MDYSNTDKITELLFYNFHLRQRKKETQEEQKKLLIE